MTPKTNALINLSNIFPYFLEVQLGPRYEGQDTINSWYPAIPPASAPPPTDITSTAHSIICEHINDSTACISRVHV